MLRITIATLTILACASVHLHASTNCYIKLVPSVDGTISEQRELIESFGGRIIHEFPETNEYICQMAPTQYTVFTERYALDSEHAQITGASVDRSGAQSTIGRSCFDQLDNLDKDIEESRNRGCGSRRTL